MYVDSCKEFHDVSYENLCGKIQFWFLIVVSIIWYLPCPGVRSYMVFSINLFSWLQVDVSNLGERSATMVNIGLSCTQTYPDLRKSILMYTLLIRQQLSYGIWCEQSILKTADKLEKPLVVYVLSGENSIHYAIEIV